MNFLADTRIVKTRKNFFLSKVLFEDTFNEASYPVNHYIISPVGETYNILVASLA